MKIRFWFKSFLIILIATLATAFAGSGMCQEINLDKMKKLGDVVCYQSLKDPATWYYLPDQPRLAMKNGKPQFSFMKYSRTSKTGKAGTNVAEGGGIVHFLVTYGTSKERVKAAQRRLQETNPDASIEGPIVYRKGSFALITSFQQDQESLVKTVAVGKAPLMEGQKAAVSMALSKQGAELLWESFKSDTPDISLVFDMEFAGVREPYEATIEADWSRVSKHKRLKAGLKYSWFGADVDMLFQELRQDGAIKITTKGENASMDKIVQSAHSKLLQVMFDPAPVDDLSKAAAQKDSYSNLNQAMKMLKDSRKSSRKTSLNMDSPGFSDLIGSILDFFISDSYASSAPELPPLPLLDDNQIKEAPEKQMKAGADKGDSKELTSQEKSELTELFKSAQKYYLEKQYEIALEIFQEWKQLHHDFTGKITGGSLWNIARCQMKLERYEEAADTFRQAAQAYKNGDPDSKDGKESLEMAQQADKLAIGKEITTTISNNQIPGEQAPDKSASDAYNHARRLDQEAKQKGYQKDAVQEAITAYEEYQIIYAPSGTRAKEVEGRLRSLKRRLAAAGGDKTSGSKTSASKSKRPDEKALAPVPESSKTSSSSPSDKSTYVSSKNQNNKSSTQRSKDTKPAARRRPSAAAKRAVENKPGFSLVASYQMKNIKRSGKMVYKMNHFRSEKQSFTMAENIGSLYSRYGNDSRVFKAVTIDDPVFKQREILVTLDGQDASTFTKYLNFVTVKMNKHHQSGSETNDEVVITPETFNTKGNSFSLNYGYKGDTDRNKWLDYKYQVIWSFHGGVEIRSPWKQENSPMLALFPPYHYRDLTIEGEGETLLQAKVRHAVITINSNIKGQQITTQVTIRNQGPAPSMHLEIPEGMKGETSEVSIIWYLKGGEKITTSPQKIQGDIIYWDELPEEGRS